MTAKLLCAVVRSRHSSEEDGVPRLRREHQTLLKGRRASEADPFRRMPGATYGAAPAGFCSRAAFRNSQADRSHSVAKNPAKNKLGPVEPNPAIKAITATDA